jgi:UDP-N-acetyl-D-mannosaminuronic acid transferase (WecB/TagA/CpsF family)
LIDKISQGTIIVLFEFVYLVFRSSEASWWRNFFRFGDFYRLVQEPTRWHRMLALPEFAAAVLKQRG